MEKTGSTPIDELVRRAIIGDGAAFTQLWDTHIVQLRSYIRSWLKNLDDFYVDDICSRSFQKAFQQIRSYDPSRSRFSTWLKTIAHNTALDTMEQIGRMQRSYVYIDGNPAEFAIADTIRDDVDSPLDSIIKDEDEEDLQASIDGLPPLYRDIARKRFVEGMQYKEIADETGLELNTVRTRIRRAKSLMDKNR